MLAKQPIGVFDSGVGGLTVAAEIFRQLPGERIIYFGDTAHVPYGPRPVKELISFAQDITRFLARQGVKMVVVACNTSSSISLEQLRQENSIPIIGVVEPGVATALRTTRNGRIGVIATEATVKNGSHERLLRSQRADLQVFPQACPLFVPLVEAGKTNSSEARRAAAAYLAPLQKAQIDTLILGCTHYPYLQEVLREVLGPGVALVNPAEATVQQVGKILRDTGLLHQAPRAMGEHRYYTSGEPEPFAQAATHLLGYKVNPVCQVDWDELQGPPVVSVQGTRQ